MSDDDLVKRLRENQPCCGVFKCEGCQEAADRIEALEKELQRRDPIPDAVVNSRAYSEFRAKVAAALRREALEEAAKVARGYSASDVQPPVDEVSYGLGRAAAAAAIRAPKDGAEEVHRSRGGNCGPGPSTSDNAFFVREEE